jgi:hypothetical protein
LPRSRLSWGAAAHAARHRVNHGQRSGAPAELSPLPGPGGRMLYATGGCSASGRPTGSRGCREGSAGCCIHGRQRASPAAPQDGRACHSRSEPPGNRIPNTAAQRERVSALYSLFLPRNLNALRLSRGSRTTARKSSAKHQNDQVGAAFPYRDGKFALFSMSSHPNVRRRCIGPDTARFTALTCGNVSSSEVYGERSLPYAKLPRVGPRPPVHGGDGAVEVDGVPENDGSGLAAVRRFSPLAR